jgi:hypothetical protein
MTSSIYNYVNNAKVWLPMTSATHDPTNVRTLDVSSNKLHFRFGNGVTSTTYPAKNSGQRGYSFDGGDYLEALANQTNALASATWAILCRIPTSTAQDIYSHWSAGPTVVRSLIWAVYGSTPPELRFYCGDIANPASIADATYLRNGHVLFVAGVLTSAGVRRIYADGRYGTDNAAGVVAPGAPVTFPRIGARGDGTSFIQPPGNVFWYGHWEYALTELQLRDLEARLRRQLNDV